MIPDMTLVKKVVLHYAQTLQTVRRDFRWVFLSNNNTYPCKAPFVKPPKPIDGGNCM